MFYSPRRSLATCRCGHRQDTHQHYRRGSDCALCSCPRWHAERAWQRRFSLLVTTRPGAAAEGFDVTSVT
jgi:hypothetical protein